MNEVEALFMLCKKIRWFISDDGLIHKPRHGIPGDSRASCWRRWPAVLLKEKSGKGRGDGATEAPEEVPTWGAPAVAADSYGDLAHQGGFGSDKRASVTVGTFYENRPGEEEGV